MDDIRVRLDAFQGPLDLLLHLVQEAEVDIHDIPVATIADQFVKHLEQGLSTLDVDKAGEFLVMASHLLVLKSRSLLPRDEPIDEDELDPRLDLVKQLIAYKRFKDAAGLLDASARANEGRFPARASGAEGERVEEAIEVDLYALVAAFRRLLKETGEEETVAVARERLPITHFVGVIFEKLLAAGGEMSFTSLVGGRPDRGYLIGAFLALLELIKLRKVRILQEGFGEIAIRVHEDAMRPEGAVERDLAKEGLEAKEDAVPAGPRVVFMGTPDFAVPALQSLVGAGMPPLLVVTPPDRPAGRGKRMKESAVAVAAKSLGLPILKTADVNGRDARDRIESTTPDVIVTAGFGQKLGGALLKLPAHGCINLHTSLLPLYRGASPVSAAIRDGATETGVTIFRMDEELDRGPILASAKSAIDPDDTVEDVTARLATSAADLLVRTLPGWISGEIPPVEQDHARATYVRKLEKDAGVVDFARPAARVRDHVRAMTPWPGAATRWLSPSGREPVPLLLHRATVLEEAPGAGGAPAGESLPLPDAAPPPPGTVLRAGRDGIDVACAPGVLRVTRLQVPGGKPLSAREFLNGRPITAGDRFG
jgi:methionyl-tRNA formyltransferase